MAYTIQINDEQRALILRAVRGLINSGDEIIIDSDRDELELLRDVLHELPANEAADPGTIHGLCL